ncbi:MAG: hypothetical protein E7559_00170 [Ruminococcaceae bacterium]|nr:hypothetical protein [Oscillospiraceae bacterium]
MNTNNVIKAAKAIIGEHFRSGLYAQHLPDWVKYINVVRTPFKECGQAQIFLIRGAGNRFFLRADNVMVLKVFSDANEQRWIEREQAIRGKLRDDEELLAHLVLPIDSFAVFDDRNHMLHCHVYLYKTPFCDTVGNTDEECVRAAIRLSSLLPCLHSLAELRIFNRDIKRSNLYADPKSGCVMIGDWSVSNNTRNNATPIGTFPEIAPEVVASSPGCENNIAKADLYSLAMTMIFYLNGMEYPDHDSVLVPHSEGKMQFPEPKLGCSSQLKQAVLRAVEHNPERRYDNCLEFYEAVRQTPEYMLYGTEEGNVSCIEDSPESVVENSEMLCEAEIKLDVDNLSEDQLEAVAQLYAKIARGLDIECEEAEQCSDSPALPSQEESVIEQAESIIPEGYEEDECFDVSELYPEPAKEEIITEVEESVIPEGYEEDKHFDVSEAYTEPPAEPTRLYNSSKVYTGPGLYPDEMEEDLSNAYTGESLDITDSAEVVCDHSADFAALRRTIRSSGKNELLYSGETVPPSAFYHTALKKAVLKNTVTIERKAFRGSDIQHVEFGERLVSIGSGAFNGTQLKEVTMPASLQHIGMGAFACCEHLATLRLPSGLRRIERRAFAYCPSLKRLYLPKGIEYIAPDAFAGTEIHIYSPENPIKYWQQKLPDNITWHKLIEKQGGAA